MWANLGLLGALLAVKVVLKFVGVHPAARRFMPEHAIYTTLLMSTGLTFGTISATYGLSAGIIDGAQFAVLVTVEVLTAITSTAVAQRFFAPRVVPVDARHGAETRGRGAVSPTAPATLDESVEPQRG